MSEANLQTVRNVPNVEVSDVTLREHGQNVTEEELEAFSVALRVSTASALVEAGFKRLELVSCDCRL